MSFGNPNFPNFPKSPKSPKSPNFPKKELGEIVICLSEVKKNAKRLKLDYNKELVRVLIHGILHLAGYDHERGEKEAGKMKDKENYYLPQFLKKRISTNY